MSQPPDDPPSPDRFGLAAATFVVVSSMIGSGVLTASGFTVRDTGSNAVMLAAWILGGVVALCGALTLAELSAALPRSGGEYAILAEAVGPTAAFLAGWVSLILGFAAPIAATAVASADYLLAPLDLATGHRVPARLLGTALILALSAVHVTGRGPSARVQGAVTSGTVLVLAVFLAAGLAVGWNHTPNLRDLPTLDRATVGNLIFSLVYISYAYTGWNGAAYLGGEVANPRLLPCAILLGTALVVALYVGLNVVYALALPAREVVDLAARQGDTAIEPIAQLAALRLFGQAWSGRLSWAFGVILAASLSALLLTGPRVAFAMARRGQFPEFAGRLSGRGQTPAHATGLLAAVAVALVWTGGLENLVIFSGVGLALFSMLSVGSIYILRVRQPDLPRPFRTPFYPVTPALYLLATAALTVAAFVRRPTEAGLALGCLLAGLPLSAVWVRRRLEGGGGGPYTGEDAAG